MVGGSTRRDGKHYAPAGVLAILVSTALLAGCGISFHVGEGETISTASYKTVWARDWKAVNAASDPWNPSGTNPGVCNKGGDQRL